MTASLPGAPWTGNIIMGLTWASGIVMWHVFELYNVTHDSDVPRRLPLQATVP